VEIFTTDEQVVSRAGSTPGVDPAAVPTLVRTRLLVDGQPIFPDDRMATGRASVVVVVLRLAHKRTSVTRSYV